MRAIILIFTLITFISCENQPPVVAKVTKSGGMVQTSNGMMNTQVELKEFDYKGHTYISCAVRDGLALTHAGHCKCN